MTPLRAIRIHLRAAMLLLCVVVSAFGVELVVSGKQATTVIAGRIVDGAGRPVEAAEVKVFTSNPRMPHLVRSYDEFKANQGEFLLLLTDKKGEFLATTNHSLPELRIAIGKKGYVGFTKSAAWALGKEPLVIYKSVNCEDVKALNAAEAEELGLGLTEVIASDEFRWSLNSKDCDLASELFKINDQLKPALRLLPENPVILPKVSRLVSYFGDEDDREILIAGVTSRKDLTKKVINETRGYIAGSLVSPKSEAEWEFLRSIITCERRYLEEDAALALAANGSARALSILKAKAKCERPPGSEQAVELAIRWIRKHPGPVKSNYDLRLSVGFASRVFNYSDRPERFQIEKIVTDQQNQKALVFCTVDGGGEAYYYQLVFQRTAGQWVLTGLWPTGIADF